MFEKLKEFFLIERGMSRRKRHVDEEDFDEYAFYDERIRGDAHRRLDDGPPSLQDYGLGPGYLGRARQSPRSPSIAGDDEIRPARRRNASPDDSDRGGERRALRKVGDAYDPDDVFDEPFVFIEPGSVPPVVRSSEVKQALLSGPIFRDWAWYQEVYYDPDSTGTNITFLRQQRVINSEGSVRLNNLQLRGAIWLVSNTAIPLPEAVFVELVVFYDRSRTFLDANGYNSSGASSNISWSDVFSPCSSGLTYPTGTEVDVPFFHFTNPETTSRFRIMFRKTFKLDVRKYIFRHAETSGTETNVDPLLDYVVNTNTFYRLSPGGPSPEYSPSKDSVLLIDEFVNLCGLPAHYRAGSPVEKAVDSEGGVYVGWRCSAPSFDAAWLRIYLNTRLNLNVVDNKNLRFF